MLSLVKSKRGSIYIEASMAMPLAVIVATALVCVTMLFYQKLSVQLAAHAEFWEKSGYGYEASYIRKTDSFEKIFS